MSKANDTGYLFAKMSSLTDETGIRNMAVGEEKDKKSQIPSTRTYHFDEGGQSKEKQSMRKWIRENVMLIMTLTGVFVGIVTGTANLLKKFSELQEFILSSNSIQSSIL